MNKSTKNMFYGGMDMDTSPTIIEQSKYVYLRNGRLIADENSTNGILENEKGNKLLFKLPTSIDSVSTIYNNGDIKYIPIATNPKIVGIHKYMDYIVVFSTTNTSDQIWLVKIDAASKEIASEYIDSTNTLLQSSCIYNDYLNLQIGSPILKAVFRQITPTVLKIYWIDGNSILRHCNLLDTNLQKSSIGELGQFGKMMIPALSHTVQSGGSLIAGQVQYAWQFYNLYGQSTLFSPPTSPVVIYSGAYNDEYLIGDKEGAITGKSLEGTLNFNTIYDEGYNYNYDRIRIIALHYTNAIGTPSARIVYDGSFSTSSDLNFIDDGVGEGTFTYEEFLYLSSNISPKVIEPHKDRLAVANITEEYFNLNEELGFIWDTRAYRFNDRQHMFLYSKEIAEITDPSDYDTRSAYSIQANSYFEYYMDGSISSMEFPNTTTNLELDCCNPFNFDLYNRSLRTSADGQLAFRYQKNGTTVGAEGPNIVLSEIGSSYSVNDAPKGSEEEDVRFYLNTNANALNPDVTVSKRFQGDEIYRIGLVAIDYYGRRSFVNWICDYKFESTITDNTYHSRILYVTIKNLSLIRDKVLAIELVTVPRTIQNSSVITEGLLNEHDPTKTFEYSGGWANLPSHTTSLNTGDWDATVGFYTPVYNPDMSTNKEIFSDSDYETFGLYSPDISFDMISFISDDIFIMPVQFYDITLYRYRDPASGSFVKCEDNTGTYSVDDFLNNYIEVSGTSVKTSGIGSVGLFGNVSGIGGREILGWEFATDPSTTSIYNRKMIKAIVKRKDISTMFGGWGYNDRRRNSYKSIGLIHNLYNYSRGGVLEDTISLSCYGDIFYTLFDFLVGETLYLSPVQNQGNIYFPTCSRINTYLESSPSFHKVRNEVEEASEPYGIYRTGVVLDGDSTEYYNSAFPLTEYDSLQLYQYNFAFSRGLSTILHIPEPLDFEDTTYFPNRIKVSEKGFSENDMDYWLIYKSNTYVDLDNHNGAITNLLEFNNKLVAYQESGVSLVPVDERSLIQTSNSQEISIGSSDIIQEPIKVDNTFGCRHLNSTCLGIRGIYSYDALQKRINLLNGDFQNIPLSTIGKIQSYINSNFNGNIKQGEQNLLTDRGASSGVLISRDIRNNRIYFTLLDNTYSDTISFNELGNYFEGFYDFIPRLFSPYLDTFVTIDKNKSYLEVYIQGEGNYNEYYDTVYPTTIDFITNAQSEFVKIWTNQQWNSDINNPSETNLFNETIDTILNTNEYQSTGAIELTSDDNVIRKGREWRYQIPFDTLTTEEDVRMRSKYLKTRMVFDNKIAGRTGWVSKDYRMRIDSILSYYIPSPPF